jgi:hypothetical protein
LQQHGKDRNESKVIAVSDGTERFRLLRHMGIIGIKANARGEILSSNELLSDGTYTKV